MPPAPLPPQPPGTDWPTVRWPTGPTPPEVAGWLDEVFADPQPAVLAETRAVVVVHRGRLVAERYAPGHGPDDTLPSWSMAKSMLHAAVGLLVGAGRIDPARPTGLPEWAADTRARITVDDLLRMVPGLRWVEDYDPGSARSDVIDMLFGEGRRDVGGFAARAPAMAPPGEVFCYSSGTSNIVARILCDVIGRGEACLRWLHEHLFGPLGIRSAVPKLDGTGTWIASSYCFMTARDFARFGLWYLRDGVWEGSRLLPSGWVDHARTLTPASRWAPDGRRYGAHWWLWHAEPDVFWASGYEGQRILLSPRRDLVVVRCGRTGADRIAAVDSWLTDLVRMFEPVHDDPPPTGGGRR